MRNSFALTYVLLTVAQMVLSNYFHFTPYMMITILPVMVLCIPTNVGTVKAMLIAFATGLAVDFFAEGTLGIPRTGRIAQRACHRDVFRQRAFRAERERHRPEIRLRQSLHSHHPDNSAVPSHLHPGRLCRDKTSMVRLHLPGSLHPGQFPGISLHHQSADP